MQSDNQPPDTPAERPGDGYEIGYGKPPKHSRFLAGQSGNPAGRRKGVRNLMTDVKRTLQVPVKVKESGRARKISTQEGALMLLREKALKGDARALDRLLELARLFNNDAGESGPAPVLASMPPFSPRCCAAISASLSGRVFRPFCRARPICQTGTSTPSSTS